MQVAGTPAGVAAGAGAKLCTPEVETSPVRSEAALERTACSFLE